MALPIGEIIIYGLALGGAYALIAIGFSFIFGVAKLLNMAHGAFFTLTGFFVWVFISEFGLNEYLSMILSLIVIFFVGVSIWYIVRPLAASLLGVLMVTFAISFVIQEGLLWRFGSETKSIPTLIGGTVTLLGVEVISQYMVMIGASIVTLFCLLTFLTKTKLGTAIRAVAQDREAAMLSGVSNDVINVLVMGISTVLVGIAAILIFPVQVLNYNSGTIWLAKCWTIVILGGLGSLKGSVAAGFIMSFIEQSLMLGIPAIGVLSAELASYLIDVVYVLIVLLVLFIRPWGLFGRPIKELL